MDWQSCSSDTMVLHCADPILEVPYSTARPDAPQVSLSSFTSTGPTPHPGMEAQKRTSLPTCQQALLQASTKHSSSSTAVVGRASITYNALKECSPQGAVLSFRHWMAMLFSSIGAHSQHRASIRLLDSWQPCCPKHNKGRLLQQEVSLLRKGQVNPSLSPQPLQFHTVMGG